MDISVEKNEKVVIVALAGNFDIAASGPFEENLTSLLDKGEKQIILDFSEVTFIASTGLRMLLMGAQRMKSEGGQLFVCCINETVQEVFEMTGFDKILSVYSARAEALEMMNQE